MTSTSSFGVSQIALQFDLNRDIDGATQDVQAAINAAAGVLPRTLPYPPTYAKVNPADAPVLTLALTSETISLRAMSDLADTILGQRLSQISGVGRVAVLGGLKPAVRVQADLARLAAYGIAMEDLRNAIAGANVSGPKGSLDGDAAGLHHHRQRPDRVRRRLQADHHRLPQRLAGHDRRRRHHRRWAGERPHRRLVPGHAGRHHRHPAPARRQRHRSRPPDPRGNSQAAARGSGRRQPDRGQRPHRHHPGLRA